MNQRKVEPRSNEDVINDVKTIVDRLPELANNVRGKNFREKIESLRFRLYSEITKVPTTAAMDVREQKEQILKDGVIVPHNLLPVVVQHMLNRGGNITVIPVDARSHYRRHDYLVRSSDMEREEIVELVDLLEKLEP